MVRLVLLRLMENYFRHRWLNLLPIVLLAAASGAFFALTGPEYEARGMLYVRKESLLSSLTQLGSEGFVWNSAASVAASDLRELAQTEAFVRAVIDETDLKGLMADPVMAEELTTSYRRNMEASTMGENLVRYGVVWNDPTTAHQLAEATLKVYKNWKLNIDIQESNVAQAFFTDLIGPYQEELDVARAELNDYLRERPDPVRGERPLNERLRIEEYQERIDLARERLQNALEKEEAARLAMTQATSENDQTYVIVDAPQIPLEPVVSLRQTVLTIGIFIAVGVILSLASIVGGAVLDRSLRMPIDVRHELHLPVLAMVADGAAPRGKKPRKATPTDQPVADLRLEDKPAQ